MSTSIQELHKAAQVARQNWANAMQELIPIGSVIQVYIGRGPIEIQVTGYGTERHREGEVRGINTKTAARRHCCFTQIIGYEFSEYDQFGSFHWASAQAKREANKAANEEAA